MRMYGTRPTILKLPLPNSSSSILGSSAGSLTVADGMVGSQHLPINPAYRKRLAVPAWFPNGSGMFYTLW